MHVTHPHPRLALVAALSALALAMAALMPAALGGGPSFSLGGDPAAPATAPSSAPPAEPAWSDNPFAHPLQLPRGNG